MSDVAPEVKVGDSAPEFTLKDQDQQDVKLSEFQGKKNVVLCFYPLDWSPVCQGENKCITDDFPQFQSANAEVFGVSCRRWRSLTTCPTTSISLTGTTTRTRRAGVAVSNG